MYHEHNRVGIPVGLGILLSAPSNESRPSGFLAICTSSRRRIVSNLARTCDAEQVP